MADEYAEAGDGSPAAKRRQVTATNFLSLDEINNAKEKKWINDWETTFYSENMAKESMSDKQMEIKTGIEQKIQRCAQQTGILDAAKAAGKITDWEYGFYCDNLGNDRLSEKQLTIKNRIDSKLGGGAGNVGGGGAPQFGAGAVAQGQFGQSQFGAGSVAQGQFGQSQFGAGQFGASTSQFGGAPAQAPNQFAAPADNPQGAFGQQLGQQMQAGFGQQGALVAPAAPPSEANLVPQADIDQAHAAGKINDWENKFYSDLIQKYADIDSFQPSERQMQFKTEIERKVTGQSLGGGEQQGGEDGYSEAWGTSMGDLVAAAGTGKITEWELKFAKDNFTRASFSEKQQAIVDRIRGKLTGEGGAEAPPAAPQVPTGFSNAWGFDASAMEDAFHSGRINDWEKDFISKNFQRESFTERQQPIVQRIQDKMAGRGGFGQQAAASAGFGQFGGGGNGGGAAPSGGGNPYLGNGGFGGHANGDDSWLDSAHGDGVINDWELKFYRENLGKASLSEKQQGVKNRIDEKLRNRGYNV